MAHVIMFAHAPGLTCDLDNSEGIGIERVPSMLSFSLYSLFEVINLTHIACVVVQHILSRCMQIMRVTLCNGLDT